MNNPQESEFGTSTEDVVVGATTSANVTEEGIPATFAGQPIKKSETGQSEGSSNSVISGAKNAATQATDQVGAAVDTAKEKTSQFADKATTTMDTGIDKAATGLDALASTIRDKSESMGGGSGPAIATTAADKLQSGAQMLREKDTDQILSDLEELVRSKPVESVLVAAGVGFVLAKILR